MTAVLVDTARCEYCAVEIELPAGPSLLVLDWLGERGWFVLDEEPDDRNANWFRVRCDLHKGLHLNPSLPIWTVGCDTCWWEEEHDDEEEAKYAERRHDCKWDSDFHAETWIASPEDLREKRARSARIAEISAENRRKEREERAYVQGLIYDDYLRHQRAVRRRPMRPRMRRPRSL